MVRAIAVAVLIALFAPQIAPARPPILGVSTVRVLTSDLTRARQFYGSLLGFRELPPSSARRAVFRVNDRQWIVADLGPDRDDRLIDVAFETADVTAMQRHLAAAHVSSMDVPDAVAAERHVVEARDPDGHHVRFVQLPQTTAAPAEPDDRRISHRILHVGLTIRNAAAADRFYKDALGFSEIWRGGRPEGVINWINMRVPEGTDYVEYMLMPAPPDRRQLGTAHHIALLVTDIQAALETVRARTGATDRNHGAVPQVGVNRRWQLNVYDPDGTRIEFMEPWTMR